MKNKLSARVYDLFTISFLIFSLIKLFFIFDHINVFLQHILIGLIFNTMIPFFLFKKMPLSYSAYIINYLSITIIIVALSALYNEAFSLFDVYADYKVLVFRIIIAFIPSMLLYSLYRLIAKFFKAKTYA